MRPVSSSHDRSERHRLAVRPLESLDDLPVGDRVAAAFAHRHLVPGMRMAVDRRVDGAAGAVRHPPDKGEIATSHLAGPAVVGELRRQRLMRRVVLGDDEQARGVLVQPVHDARPLHPANAGQTLAAMGDQRIDERPGLVTGAGMHDEAGRLVDDDEVVVLVDDIERDILAQGLRGDRLGHVDCDRIASRDMISGVADGRVS